MTPKEHRARLFSKSKPDLSSQLTEKDFGWMYIAAQKFGVKCTYEQFMETAVEKMQGFVVDIIHDDAALDGAKGRLPIGIVMNEYDGQWRLVPHVEWYPWATTRNKLRGAVAWLQKYRWSKEIGIIVFETKTPKWFQGLRKYIPNLYGAGRINAGSQDSDLWVFTLRGRKKTLQEMEARKTVEA